ncbi:hypothetical protein B0H16DRAFT_1482521 [Mycena metata]|uniref:Uncharacterized protein n=1 Tax=Mycena metata TaxID=1033252 RepID=A0AAD7GT14_9AGAR|nr:hypothetical protein B0H16DRAFT_1482521 [Mycena metata]
MPDRHDTAPSLDVARVGIEAPSVVLIPPGSHGRAQGGEPLHDHIRGSAPPRTFPGRVAVFPVDASSMDIRAYNTGRGGCTDRTAMSASQHTSSTRSTTPDTPTPPGGPAHVLDGHRRGATPILSHDAHAYHDPDDLKGAGAGVRAGTSAIFGRPGGGVDSVGAFAHVARKARVRGERAASMSMSVAIAGANILGQRARVEVHAIVARTPPLCAAFCPRTLALVLSTTISVSTLFPGAQPLHCLNLPFGMSGDRRGILGACFVLVVADDVESL